MLPKLHLTTMVIETTRKCNMHCAHCMRGPAQNKNLNPEALDRLFSRIADITSITPTGGEPTLNPKSLDQIKNAIETYQISVGGIYLVTNGLNMTRDYLRKFMDLLLVTELDETACGLALSIDKYHDRIPAENIALMSLLKCFDDQEKNMDWDKFPPMAIGNGKNLDNTVPEREHYDGLDYAEIDENGDLYLPETNLTLTVDGDLLFDCDYAYENTDELKFCNVFDDDWFEQLQDKINAAVENN